MRLLNHTTIYLSGSLLFIIGIWAVIFYFSMLDEVYDSLDDGLDNYKMLIIQKAQKDTAVLQKSMFDEGNYLIRQVDERSALQLKESYKDTLMYMQNEEDFEPVRLLTTVFKIAPASYYELKVISSMVEEDDLIEDLTYALIWLYAIIIVSIIIINNLLLKKIWQPFYDLIAQLKSFSLKTGNSFKTPVTQVQEFNTLNEAVIDLLDKNIKIYESQKHFIENASHELQTPVAISINKLEVMLEDPAFNEKQITGVSEVLQTLQRLSHMNRSLLLLSKIENKQFFDQQPVDFNELLRFYVSEFSQLIEFKNIKVEFQEESLFKQSFNKELAGVLITNLLKNAITHNQWGGALSIYVKEDSIALSNSGNTALDPQKIFQRFYKDPEKKGSTGLGLAIVKTIADLHSMKLEYSYDKVHTFILHT